MVAMRYLTAALKCQDIEFLLSSEAKARYTEKMKLIKIRSLAMRSIDDVLPVEASDLVVL